MSCLIKDPWLRHFPSTPQPHPRHSLLRDQDPACLALFPPSSLMWRSICTSTDMGRRGWGTTTFFCNSVSPPPLAWCIVASDAPEGRVWLWNPLAQESAPSSPSRHWKDGHGTTEDYGVLNPKWDSTCPTVDQNIQGKGSRKSEAEDELKKPCFLDTA